MKVPVTGAGGFLGGALVQRLLEQGHQVYTLQRSLYPKLDRLGVSNFQGDLRDPAAVARASLDCVNPRIAYAVGAVLEAIYSILRLQSEPLVTRFVVLQLVKAHWFDPQVSIEEGMRRLRRELSRTDGSEIP